MITLNRPWLEFDLGHDMQVLSWSLNRPGFVKTRRILWREVRNTDLPTELDVDAWLASELRQHNSSDAVTMLTSRDIGCFVDEVARIGNTTAHAVATVGLSNAERVGHRVDRSGQSWGTINIALRLDHAMTEAAMIETMALVVQARTAAVMDVGLKLPTGIATGTGTDCVAVACPAGKTRFAGLHTEIGEATGRAVYAAVRKGADEWVRQTEASHAT